MSVAVLMPYTSGCEYRERARGYVIGHYAKHHAGWKLVEGTCSGPWSKGAALTDAASRTDADVLVVADADSYIDPSILYEAVRIVTEGEAQWVVPHLRVRRYDDLTTARIYAGQEPSRRTVRQPYRGVKGGGITIVARQAWDTVRGVDSRFLGWGGEDMAFGWALETLCGRCKRLDGDLHHLWHPPATTNLRGTPETEALAGQYRDAHRLPRLMRALVERRDPDPPSVLPAPVLFRSRTPNLIAKNGGHVVARFRAGQFVTTDADVVDVLRLLPSVEEVAA